MLYQKIYILPADSPPLFARHSGANILEGGEPLDLGQKAITYAIEPEVSEEYSDGSTGTGSEKLSLDCGSFRTDKEYAAKLRGYHNMIKNVLLWDLSATQNNICLLKNLRLSVQIVAVSRESAIIKLSATRSFSSETLPSAVIETDAEADFGILRGTIYRKGGSGPLPDVTIKIGGQQQYVSNAEGKYHIAAYYGNQTISLHHASLSFPVLSTESIVAGEERVKDYESTT